MPNENEEENTELEDVVNPLEMSDEDIDNFDFAALDALEEEEELSEEKDKNLEEEESDDTNILDSDDEDLGNPEDKKDAADDSTLEEEGKDKEGDDSDDKKSDDKEDKDADGKEELSEEDKTKLAEVEQAALDYKAEYERLLTPFRANNKEMQVDNIDDARKLMQMGANYNKKMAGLKPNLKLLKMLENNDLLNEEKLSYLIDLDKKNPGAVTKLLKESGVDPLEIDMEAENEYKTPNTYTVNDKEVELDGVLGEIQDTDTFNTTIDIISNKWDEQSRQKLLDNPEAIRFINDHVATGIYERISGVVEQERMLGKLKGLSDLEAYKTVGDAINAAGGFNEPETESNTAEIVKRKPNKQTDNAELRSKKKAASSTKAAPAKKADKSEFNPLSLSDEEFEKMAESKFI